MILLPDLCKLTKDLTPNLHSIWFLYFVNAFQSSVFSSLSPYISSSFQAHSLSGVPMALADAFTAACYLPVGKLMDTWGRAQGFLLMTICATLGLILFASCDSFAIYCVGYVRSPKEIYPKLLQY
jgi:MFS family permease